MHPSQNKKNSEVDVHRGALGLVYVRVRLVSSSPFADLKMADPVGFGISLLIFSHFRRVGVASKPTKGTLC